MGIDIEQLLENGLPIKHCGFGYMAGVREK